jgi:hypothetical protein
VDVHNLSGRAGNHKAEENENRVSGNQEEMFHLFSEPLCTMSMAYFDGILILVIWKKHGGEIFSS